ncbi:MAG: VWA domain-containing protein [Nitrososphaerales archaeon]|nr:VWA domain-containing protein [Nitrososphaerales archaeon]
MPTKEEILRQADKARNYWGVKLDVTFVPRGSSAPFSMRWGEVMLGEEILGFSREQALREVMHEFGHRAQEPGTQAGQLLWEAIATEEGVEQPQDFTNVMSDAAIERANTVGHLLGVCPWADAYARGLRETLGEHPARGLPDGVKLLREMDRMTLSEWSGRKKPKGKSDLAARCYGALFNDDRSKPNRIRDLARLTKDLFTEPLDYDEDWNSSDDTKEGKRKKEPGGDASSGKGSEPLRPMLVKPLPAKGKMSSSEAQEVAMALAKLYGELSEETKQLLKSREKRIVRHLTVWSAYSKVIPIVKKFVGKHESQVTVPASRWSLGMPLKKLDIKATVSRYGAIIPGITTLARMEVKQKTTSTGLGNLCLIVDSSGSMEGEKVDRVVEAAIGLIETANYFGDYFSLISIVGEAYRAAVLKETVFEPSRDYGAAVSAIIDVEGFGDCLAGMMMERAVSYAKRVGRQLTMVLSDNIPPDNFCDHIRQIRDLSRYGPVIFIVFTGEAWDHTREVIGGVQNVSAVLVEDPTKPFTWEVLEPVWRQAGSAYTSVE